MTDPIVTEARAAVAALSKLPMDPALKASELWEDVLDERHRGVIRGAVSPFDVTGPATLEDYFTYPTLANDPICSSIFSNYEAWFSAANCPLNRMGDEYQESHLTHPDVVFKRGSKRFSTAFLWHLATLQRFADLISGRDIVLELGAGFGGLARLIKLRHPRARIVLLDMRESLFFSYVFLKANFPAANIVFATTPEHVRLEGDYDFLLVSNELIGALKGQSVDLVVNTQSLSEMTQAAYDRFVTLIEDEMVVRYFYNANRYGVHEDGLRLEGRIDHWTSPDGCLSAAALDRYWHARYWNLYRDDNIAGLDPRIMRVLEILIERIPRNLRDDVQLASIAEGMFTEATNRMKIDDRWHQLMWSATRYDPKPAYLERYALVLETKDFPQARYYRAMAAKQR